MTSLLTVKPQHKQTNKTIICGKSEFQSAMRNKDETKFKFSNLGYKHFSLSAVNFALG